MYDLELERTLAAQPKVFEMMIHLCISANRGTILHIEDKNTSLSQIM